jgi:N-methylhydantoinase B
MAVDQTRLAILANAFYAIADEMGSILVRSAFSHIVREARDCSTALLDADGNVIAQAEMIPLHNGGLSEAFRGSAAQLDLSEIGPDSAILTNDPYAGGQHLNDFILFQPIFAGDELIGWAGNTVHHLDVGGGGAGINIHADELIQEGIILPPMLIDVKRDLDGGSIERLIFANVRTPDLGRGDFYAQLAANRIGQSRVAELAARHGTGVLRAAMTESLDYAERRMKAAIATIPEGSWTGEAWIDGDVGRTDRLTVRVRVTVTGEEMEMDFTGTDPQVDSMFNASKASCLASAMTAVRCVLSDKGIPANDGCNRPIRVHFPEGSFINPTPGHPVRARVEGAYRVLDAVHDALASAMPDRIPAQGYNSTTGLYLTQKRPDGRMRIYGDVLGGGYGAAPAYDGAHALACIMSSSRNTPIEAIERIHDQIRMKHYRLVPDSCGAGQWRGGLGFARAIEILEDGIRLSYYSDRFAYPPCGKQGGRDAMPGVIEVIRGEERFTLPATAMMDLKKGDVVELRAGGGAGWGDPERRDPALIDTDLADGLVSTDYVARHYPQHAAADADRG